MRSPVSPAPSTSTRQGLRSPKSFSARSTAADATDTAPRPMLVCERTCLATRNARWKSGFSTRAVVPAPAATR